MQIKSISGKTLCNHEYDADNCEHCGKYEYCRVIVAQQRKLDEWKYETQCHMDIVTQTKGNWHEACAYIIELQAQNKAYADVLAKVREVLVSVSFRSGLGSDEEVIQEAIAAIERAGGEGK
jgi:hypothetical protein